ncbi:MAG: ABC transporter permease [Clostridia bacterium]|nr:ABC transporter permease [Clostridia bacterium]
MFKYVVKRLLLAVFILFAVSVILYFLVRMMPSNIIINRYLSVHDKTDTGDWVDFYIGGQVQQLPVELIEILERYNLADNTFGGIIKGWWGWITSFFAGDFGTCLTNNEQVGDIIFRNMGVSFAIALVSLFLELIIAIPLGIKCACNQYGKLDYTVTVFTMIGISFPSFFFASILIKIFAVDLGWFPIGNLYTPTANYTGFMKFLDLSWHLVLPIVVLTILSIGSMMRYTRTNTLEVLNADYIRTARAKGLSEGKVVYKHVFRNTLIPLVTTLAGILPSLFGGSMIVEQVFAIQGIGSVAYNMTLNGDVPFIMAYDMFIAVLTVIGILLTDIMYAIVDPRVKLGK